MLEYPRIKDFFIYLDRILVYFITGYFALFVIYDETFLNYDVITRVVLSIAASLLLLIPAILMFRGPDVTEDIVKWIRFFNGIGIISLFSIIKLFNFEESLKNEPLLFFIIYGIIIIINVFFLFLEE
ncbi:hypothetical protein [Candidatus Pyrohabitans sp.]